ETAAAGRDVPQGDGAVRGQCLLQIVAVVAFGGPGAHHVVMLFRNLGDGEFRANAAAAGEGVAKRHAPDPDRHLVGHQAVEPRFRAWSGHFVFGERGKVYDPDIPPHTLHLIANVLEIIGTAKTPLVHGRCTRRGEPIGPLPAIALAEHRTHPGELVVDWAGL